ncbi:MAG: hypothetical protein ABIF82_00895 [Planctomycetota bacterium]
MARTWADGAATQRQGAHVDSTPWVGEEYIDMDGGKQEDGEVAVGLQLAQGLGGRPPLATAVLPPEVVPVLPGRDLLPEVEAAGEVLDVEELGLDPAVQALGLGLGVGTTFSRSAPNPGVLRRSSSTAASSDGFVLCGQVFGRRLRSKRPGGPSARYRSRHLRTVLGVVPNARAVGFTPISRADRTIRMR